MNILQMFTTGLCGALAWLFIMPSRHIPNKRYLRLFWFFFIIFFSFRFRDNGYQWYT